METDHKNYKSKLTSSEHTADLRRSNLRSSLDFPFKSTTH